MTPPLVVGNPCMATKPPTLCFNGVGPASLRLQGRDQSTGDGLMNKDYNGLPAPWQWLKDAKPEPGQHCEWVALGPSWTGTGQGEWTEIDTGVNPDTHFSSAPNCGQVIVIGFRDEKGVAVYDPTFTAWRSIPSQSYPCLS